MAGLAGKCGATGKVAGAKAIELQAGAESESYKPESTYGGAGACYPRRHRQLDRRSASTAEGRSLAPPPLSEQERG